MIQKNSQNTLFKKIFKKITFFMKFQDKHYFKRNH